MEEKKEELEGILDDLKELPFGMILKARARGFTHKPKQTPKPNQPPSHPSATKIETSNPPKIEKEIRAKKNKNRPKERSSKIGVSVLDKPNPKAKGRDPRFDQTSGKYNSDLFSKTYSFLTDQMQEEKLHLETKIKKLNKIKFHDTTKDEKLSTMKNELSDIKQTLNKKSHETTVRGVKTDLTSLNRKRVEKGLNPYFLKKREMKELLLKKKYESLDKTNKLDAYMKDKMKAKENKLKGKLKAVENRKRIKIREEIN